jgi:hypothetical protein
MFSLNFAAEALNFWNELVRNWISCRNVEPRKKAKKVSAERAKHRGLSEREGCSLHVPR